MTIRIRQADGELEFEVRDDGVGFEPDATGGTGLQGMADRLDAVGGALESRARRARGTRTRPAGSPPGPTSRLVQAGCAAAQASSSRSGPNADFGM